jgi:hypothetical protein
MVLAWLLLSGALVYARAAVTATQPLGARQTLLVTTVLLVAAWFARSALGSSRPPSRRRAAALPNVVTSVALVLWGMSLGRGSGLPALLAWSLFLGEEGWAWFRQAAWFRRLPHLAQNGRSSADRLIQQMTRTLTPHGEEIIRGSLAVRIDRGSRMAAGHVAFCPPFVERPSFHVESDDRENATLKVSQLFPHGARIEVRLPQMARADITVYVRFIAQARQAVAVPG